MSKTIKADVKGSDTLARFWEGYFPETPVCSLPDCGGVASEVDLFFPYLDDLNRCANHPLEFQEPPRRSARGCMRGGLHSVSGERSQASSLSLAMKHRMRFHN